jgi:hypothetical protein
MTLRDALVVIVLGLLALLLLAVLFGNGVPLDL